MKFLIVFVLALVTAASAFDLRDANIESRSVVVPEGRITNGNTASRGQFPYQVGLSVRVNTVSSAWCGGSLISNQWVLTAAHCTDGMSAVTVYLGATLRTSADITITVSKNDIIIHSEWTASSHINDISLIRIPFVSYTPRIKAVKLPAIASSYPNYIDSVGIISGWGRISDTTTTVTDNLQWARMLVISNAVCEFDYGTFVTSSNICVSTAGGTSPCNGDSGGPLVLESNSIQIGLSSFGAAAGCTLGYSAVFTRVTNYLEWIKSNTGISY